MAERGSGRSGHNPVAFLRRGREALPRVGQGRTRLALAVVLLAAVVLRLAPLGRYVTPDEPAWVYRSIRFADALSAGDWAAVPSTGHPGVTTMWLGAAGVAAATLTDRAASAVHLEWIRNLAWLSPENGEAFRHLATFLPFGRVAVNLTTCLALLALYALVARLFGRQVGLLTTGLLALDPFLIGHSGLLHTDALMASFCTLSLLCLLVGVRQQRAAWAWGLASGAAAGLALLTKSLAVFLVPFALLVVVSATALRRMRAATAVGMLASWAAGCAGLYVGLYPAMWVAPLQTLRDLFGAPSYHATAALMPTFFAGQVALRHGPEFYAVALPFRFSPIVLVGVVLAGRAFFRERSLRPDLAWLALYVAGYLALLALNVKKYDRYLLPVFPALALGAAMGYVHLAPAGARSWRAILRLPGRLLARSVLVPLLLVIQLAILVPFFTCPLTYYDPLLGGPPMAVRLLPVGWGEGTGAAARWLNRLPQADRLTVAALSVPSFASLFAGRTVPIEQAALADYLVLEGNQPTEQALDLPDVETVHTARLGFLDYGLVLANTAPRQQADFLAARVGPGDLVLLDADTPLLHQYQGPGSLFSVAGLPDEPTIAARLTQLAEGREAIWVVASPAASPITATYLRRQVELRATAVETSTVASAHIVRYAPRPGAASGAPAPYRTAFDGLLALVDGTAPSEAAWPERLRVTLRWRALATPATDYRAVLSLQDQEGGEWSTAESLVLNAVDFPTAAWADGEWTDLVYHLSLPGGTPPGRYALVVALYDTRSGAGAGGAAPSGTFLGTQVHVASVAVVPPAVPPRPDALGMAEPRELPVGPLRLLGLNPPPGQALSGDRLPFALFWQADAAPEEDLRARLRLVGSSGSTGPESIVPLSPHPTSRWAAGDRFESRHDLHVLPDLAPGRYELTLNVLTAAGSPLWADDLSLAEVEVLPRQRSFDLPADVPHSLDLLFGEAIRLRGYGLDRTEAGPGDSLHLTLIWQAEGPADADYTVFAHLLDPTGLPRGQADSQPSPPTSTWAPGQVVTQQVTIVVAPDAAPGLYHIAVGLYHAPSGYRLHTADGTGALALPTAITIGGGTP